MLEKLKIQAAMREKYGGGRVEITWPCIYYPKCLSGQASLQQNRQCFSYLCERNANDN